ncbi:MAG: FAD-binding oxidoreductase [Flavobacteriaceae bacterium]
MKVDYIIVGLGLAGLSFIETLEKNNKSYVVFENESQTSSKVAAGMFNPVVLKRFIPVWNGKDQLSIAIPFFELLENKFSSKYIQYVDIYRVFKSVEEQNNWFIACDNPLLATYMSTKILSNENNNIIAPFGFGRLINTGRIDLESLLHDYYAKLSEENKIIKDSFKHEKLEISDTNMKYNDIEAKKIVFCEGFGLKANPFFNYLPMNEAKGELITIKAPDLKIDFMLKAAVFVLPLGNDFYKVGATFNWKDKTSTPSDEGKSELIEKLETTINTQYKIVNHVAGIRPTVKDRRPLIGIHPTYKNMAILNGLGTRGVMLGPTMALSLFDRIENNKPLDEEIDIKRYASYLN